MKLSISIESANKRRSYSDRRGATIVFTAIFLVVMFAMAAFAIEVGTMMVARAKMQGAADAAALAGASVLSQGVDEARALAKEYAGYHDFFGTSVELADSDIEIGFYDEPTNVFEANPDGNAVQVVARIDNVGLVFGSLIGQSTFERRASAVAIAPARDIVFVVDLSGSMNDDSEPAWATKTVNAMFDGTEFEDVGNDLVQHLYDDLGYGDYPGELKYIGHTLGVAEGVDAYNQMTKDHGPLSLSSIPATYRISASDSEATRKRKCYSWIIDNEIATVMPSVKPDANSGTNYAYWSQYLNYIIRSQYVHTTPWESSGGGGSGSGGGGETGPEPPATGFHLPKQHAIENSGFQFARYRRPTAIAVEDTPVDRGWIPPSIGSYRIYRFNNPNTYAFPSGDDSTRWRLRNKVGYQSYVQFMLDFGREDKPANTQFVPISLNSPDCPLHLESTDGGDFWFPPRTQPMHSCRRALISAINVVKTRNAAFGSGQERDKVSIITFDKLSSGAITVQPLTEDYDAAMLVCTNLQASIDEGRTTATELGLSSAYEYIKPAREGGSGRNNVNKVVVMLTDGLPNDFASEADAISDYMTENPHDDFYGGGYDWLDAPLMQTKIMSRKGWQVYPVGIGFGTDYDFMDRMSRMGATAVGGESLRGSGNPALYEQRLRELFRDIIQDPQVNLAR